MCGFWMPSFLTLVGVFDEACVSFTVLCSCGVLPTRVVVMAHAWCFMFPFETTELFKFVGCMDFLALMGDLVDTITFLDHFSHEGIIPMSRAYEVVLAQEFK